MALYSSSNLSRRNTIIQTHKLLGNFLDSNMINNLIILFDNTSNNSNKITTYIENERKLKKLDDSNVIVRSEVYGYNSNNSTLYLEIRKNNIEFIHCSIHLTAKDLKPQKDGLIHIFKDFYIKRSPSAKRRLLYALILVDKPIDKPNSLHFSIGDGYITPPEVIDSKEYDPEIQQEMDVIISVLNRLFDEDDEYYISNNSIVYPIHNKTNLVLNNINKHTTILTRKNKGKFLYPTSISIESPISINYKRNRLHKTYYKSKNKKRGITYKVRK